MARINVVMVRFDLNRKGVAAIAVGPEVKAAVHDVAELGKAYAVAISPRSTRAHQHYADSFEINDTVMHGFPREFPMSRAAAQLANTARHAIIVEVGAARVENGRTIEIRPHRVLERTLEFLAAVGKL